MNDVIKRIPEQTIKESALFSKRNDEKNNSFEQMLEYAEEFKKAGMTPIFLLHTKTMQLGVAAEETFNKKLH